MKNLTNGSDLFADAESFLSELSMQEESLLSGGCGKSVKNKSGKKGGKSKKSGSGKSRSGCGIPVVIGSGY